MRSMERSVATWPVAAARLLSLPLVPGVAQTPLRGFSKDKTENVRGRWEATAGTRLKLKTRGRTTCA
jgi:hypothetical protein